MGRFWTVMVSGGALALLAWCGAALGEDARYGIGHPASPEEIARVDIDVRPNGEGLPLGAGSARQGRPIYLEKCAACHGETGTEGPFDMLSGRLPGDAFPFAEDPRAKKTIGSYWPYATTIFDYVRRAMPADAPGSLSDDEVYALTAYLLFLNELVEEDAVLVAARLPQIHMPAREYFYMDERVAPLVAGGDADE